MIITPVTAQILLRSGRAHQNVYGFVHEALWSLDDMVEMLRNLQRQRRLDTTSRLAFEAHIDNVAAALRRVRP
ncbi:MAG TPA: hypothetical protein VGH84_10710 [Steroidobacteraceae bacterium]|jgi:hypothetical protein